MSEIADDELSFRNGSHERLLRTNPGSLTAVGFSTISFVLMPTQNVVDLFLRFAAVPHLCQNCFVDMLKRKFTEAFGALMLIQSKPTKRTFLMFG